MLKIQKYISCFDDIREANLHLKAKLRIDVSETVMYDEGKGYIFYQYCPNAKADMGNPIVRETQGLILDDDGDIVSKMFDWPLTTDSYGAYAFRQEPMPDGELLAVYNIEGVWRVSSRVSMFASEYLKDALPGETFANMLFEVLGGDSSFRLVHPSLIYVFSLISNRNRILLPYNGTAAYLITIIDRTTGKELPMGVIDKIARRSNLNQPVNGGAFKTLEPGYLIRTRDDRLFIPNPIYNAVKNAIDAKERVKPIHIAKIYSVLRDIRDLDVVGLTYPHFERMLDLLEEANDSAVTELIHLWNVAHEYINEPKKFANIVKGHALNSILFQYKDQKINNVRKAVAQQKPEKLIELAASYSPKRFNTYEKLLLMGKDND